ncbi:uncharacterized protein MELLADRAFT_114371 [Melampsora larici-populina 98AG31]|uniref:DEK C-terminal domain-containing protein n=1 Tax=Melampsora larici-populina (strain 98AG31 / pathotype 3-4-7) TaxID=747676 RepID=F4SD79_MELLP|nr:uncharacterized protein MELLADRAFT_114371 [Melampsora larici-populina 98AG31]EGF97395.1 hypothetical protein MELLADRAFT_114371 [Melampsora larici-populina 98AG31]
MEPTSNEIIKEVKLICREAISSGDQEELTPRTIINELVKRLSVDEVYFKQKEIKMLIKSTAASTLEETSGSDDESKAKEDSISVKQSSPEAQVPSESSSQTKPKSSAKGRKSTKKEKIKDTSCEPQVSESSKPKIELTASDSGESSKSESVKQKAPRKRGPKTEKKNEIKSAQFLDSDGEPVAESPPTIAPPSKAKRKSTGEDHESAPPAKQSKTKSKATKSTKVLSTDDKHAKEIKRLKGYVIACGVRKRWAQEFASCNTPQSQIQRIKIILSELGMPNRYSMSKAEEIRQKRELADDLNSLQPSQDDDVDEDDKKKNKKGKMVIDSDGSDNDDQDQDGAEGKTKVKKNPYAFLGQNEGDDSD